LTSFFAASELLISLATLKKNLFQKKKKQMNEENKFLSRSRERAKWKNKLSKNIKKEAKADSIYFRPNLSDDKRIRELAELTGETKNAIVEKLVVAVRQ
jgi:phosphorylcholine metabolism protein LicD